MDDIVHILCPYLDLGSLSCFAAAYPPWSSIVYRHLKKRMPSINLCLRFANQSASVESLALIECDKRDEETSEYGVVQYAVEERPMSAWEWETRPTSEDACWETLPRSAWIYVPFDIMDIFCVHVVGIKTEDFCPDEFLLLLSKVTTSILVSYICDREEARKVLQKVSFSSDSYLIIGDCSVAPNGKPILELNQLKNLVRLMYSGRAETISVDLHVALQMDHTLLSVQDSPNLVAWVKKFVQMFLDEHGDLVRCNRRGRLEYEFTRVNDGDNAAHRDGSLRRIAIYERTAPPMDFLKEPGIVFILGGIPQSL